MNRCISSVLTTAIAGLTAAAHAQSLTIEFRADRTTATVGETVRWEVIVHFDDYPDPEAKFGGIEGVFESSDPALGVASNLVNYMGASAYVPTINGATIGSVYIFEGCVLHGCPTYSGWQVFSFDVEIADDSAALWYDAPGTGWVFADDGIFTLPDEYCRRDACPGPFHTPSPMFAVVSDVVNFRGCDDTDLAAPFSVKDSADINAFANLFLGQAPIVDFAEPLGVHDLADIAGFVQRFAVGCP